LGTAPLVRDRGLLSHSLTLAEFRAVFR